MAVCACAVWACAFANSALASAAALKEIRASTIRLIVTTQRPDPFVPWQTGRQGTGTGTAFFIGRNRLMTNAHVVSDARFIEAQRDGDARRYRARVLFTGHDCDLAVLTVDESGFFEGMKPVRFGDRLPDLHEQVTVVGFPMGGSRLSVTRGVVSRLDYGMYSHSAVDQHLVMQVDAAINPGNSGGPVVWNGRVVAAAFQGLQRADNIGYAIPLPVISHFLKDIEDGRYQGYPELGLSYVDTRNGALRALLKMPAGRTGVAVTHVDPFGATAGRLRPGDVLMEIDGRSIADDGTVSLDGQVVIFPEVIERKLWGESVEMTAWRTGGVERITMPLTPAPSPFIFRNTYDCRPRYVVHAGLVFSPLTRDLLLATASDDPNARVHALSYYARYATIDGWHRERDEFVMLMRRLPHPVNTYADDFVFGVVNEINGVPIRRLEDMPAALAAAKGGFTVLRFADRDDTLIVDARAAAEAENIINQAYGVTQAVNFDETPIGADEAGVPADGKAVEP